MMRMTHYLIAAAFMLLLCATETFASATSVSITQSGSAVGNCTTNVQTPAFFNNASNWGSGSSQIGPGTTVLICGTITVAQGGTGLTVQGSGTSASPILIKFDTGTILQSVQFAGGNAGGGIYINGRSYIVIDGGTNGIIQNTGTGSSNKTCLSGSACSVQASSYGIFAAKATNLEVKNLTIRDVYLWGCCGSDSSAAYDSEDVGIDGGTNILIHNNTLNDAHMGVYASFDHNDLSNVQIYNNTIQHHGWSINASNGTSNTTAATGVKVYNNSISDWSDWNVGGDSSFHTDGVFTYNTEGSANVYNPLIYNNLFYGDLDGGKDAATGYIWCAGAAGGAGVGFCTVFNNVFDMTGTPYYFSPIWEHQTGKFLFYNNTLLGNGVSGMPAIIPIGPAIVENNVFINFYKFYDNLYGPLSSQVTSNNNVFYNCTGSSSTCFQGTDGSWSIASWQTGGHDAKSITTNAQVNASTYQLASTSPAIAAGANLTDLSIAALNTGAPQTFGIGGSCGGGCVARPSSGAWSIGAFQFGNNVPPPTGLTTTVTVP